MTSWGKRKDGQAYPKNRTSKSKRSGSTKSAGSKIKRNKSPRYSKGQQKLFDKLKHANSKTTLTKQEVQNIKNALNGSTGGKASASFGKAANSLLWNYHDMHEGVSITPEHNRQGYDWLKKQSEDHMGYREKEMFTDFVGIKLIGFKDEATNKQSSMEITNMVPVWHVYNKLGYVFQYYMDRKGQLSISG